MFEERTDGKENMDRCGCSGVMQGQRKHQKGSSEAHHEGNMDPREQKEAGHPVRDGGGEHQVPSRLDPVSDVFSGSILGTNIVRQWSQMRSSQVSSIRVFDSDETWTFRFDAISTGIVAR